MSATRRRWFCVLVLTLALVLAQSQAALAASVRLTTDPLTNDVRSLKISPDGKYLVYETLPPNLPGEWSLYSVPLSGGPQVQLANYFGTYAGETQFHITPDSTHVIYAFLTQGRPTGPTSGACPSPARWMPRWNSARPTALRAA